MAVSAMCSSGASRKTSERSSGPRTRSNGRPASCRPQCSASLRPAAAGTAELEEHRQVEDGGLRIEPFDEPDALLTEGEREAAGGGGVEPEPSAHTGGGKPLPYFGVDGNSQGQRFEGLIFEQRAEWQLDAEGAADARRHL